MNNYHKKDGLVVATLCLVLIGCLSYLAWRAFSFEFETIVPNTEVSEPQTNETLPQTVPSGNGLRTYTSTTGSGLSLDYPETWIAENMTRINRGAGRGELIRHRLISREIEIDQSDTSVRRPVNDYMCITMTESLGEGSSPNVFPRVREVASEDFQSADVLYRLKTYSSFTTRLRNMSMANVMRLESDFMPESPQFLKANNNYTVVVQAQFNCNQGGTSIRNVGNDFFTQPETTQAVQSLKSIRFE